MGAEVNLPDVTTGDPQVQPSPSGSVSEWRDVMCESQQRAAVSSLALPARRSHLSRRYFQQPSCCSLASSLCLGLSGLDSLTDDPSCHQSQYWMHRDNTGNSLLCEDRHLWSICETILAKEDRQLYFVPNIAWQVWTHPEITLSSSQLEGQESTSDRENRLWHSDRKMKTQQHPEKKPNKPLCKPGVPDLTFPRA